MPDKKPLTLESFLRPVLELRKLGPLGKLLKQMPGPFREMAQQISDAEIESQLDGAEMILASLTPAEREDPGLRLDRARREAVARSAEVPLGEVDALLSQFEWARGFRPPF